jgi:hypothetical protein
MCWASTRKPSHVRMTPARSLSRIISTPLRTMPSYAAAALCGRERGNHGKHKNIVQTVQWRGQPPVAASCQATVVEIVFFSAWHHAPPEDRKGVTSCQSVGGWLEPRRAVPTPARPSRHDEGEGGHGTPDMRPSSCPPDDDASIRFHPLHNRRPRTIRFPLFRCRGTKVPVIVAHRLRCRRKRLFYLWQRFSPVMQYTGRLARCFARCKGKCTRYARPCSKRQPSPFSHLLVGEKLPPRGSRMRCIKTGADVSVGSSACQRCVSPCAAWLAASAGSDQRLSAAMAAWRARRVAVGLPLHGRWAHTPAERQPVQGRLV